VLIIRRFVIMPEFTCLIKQRRTLFSLVIFSLLLLSGVVLAQEVLQKSISDLDFRTSDLIFEIEDLGGEIEELELKETETEVKIELSGDILFDFDKWDIRPEAEPVLKKVADVIREYPDASVLVEGHTDSKGSESYNLRLSQRRADSVKDWLVKNGGIDGNRIVTKGWGEQKPVAPNTNPDGSDNPEGRQKNRRVEITVKKE